jgi:peptide/nickel transport system permease protein
MSNEDTDRSELTFRDLDPDVGVDTGAGADGDAGAGAATAGRGGLRLRPTVRGAGQLLAYLLVGGAFLVDLLVVESGDPLIAEWDVTSVDWLFVTTLAFLAFNLVVPLYRNRRLTVRYWRRFRRNRLAVYSGWVVLFISLLGFFGPLLIEPPTLSLTDAYLPPVGVTARPEGTPVTGTWEYPLGTNQQGQGMLALLVYGARVSLQIALISTLLATVIGTAFGATGAFVGGLVDEVLFRYVDLQSTFPTFILLLLLVFLYGAKLWYIIVLYGLFSWEGTARLVRAEALQRTEEAYVRASEAAGASRSWVILRHVVPNVSSTIITVATLSIPGFVLGEAALAFLGFSQDGIFSWGTTIAGGRGDLATAPWITTIPGFFLFFFVLCINTVGDALTDAFDARREVGR